MVTTDEKVIYIGKQTNVFQVHIFKKEHTVTMLHTVDLSKDNKILRWNGLTDIIETLEIPWAHRTWTICQKVWVKVCKSLRRRTTSNQLALPPAAHAELGTELRSVCPFVVQSKLKAAELKFTSKPKHMVYVKVFEWILVGIVQWFLIQNKVALLQL